MSKNLPKTSCTYCGSSIEPLKTPEERLCIFCGARETVEASCCLQSRSLVSADRVIGIPMDVERGAAPIVKRMQDFEKTSWIKAGASCATC